MSPFLRPYFELPMAYLLVCMLSIGLLFGCAVAPVSNRSEQAFMHLNSKDEVALGKLAFLRVIQMKGGTYRDDHLANYVAAVGQRLASVSSRPELHFTFQVLNDSSPNAFALPGGYIAITRGLLVNLTNEAELAAVLGHEVGHVCARHSPQGMPSGALPASTARALHGLAAATGYIGIVHQLSGIATDLIVKRYSHAEEAEADRLGIGYLVRAGYNPLGALQLQQYFLRELEKGAPQWLNGLFRKHPFSADRLAENRRYIASHYPHATGTGQDVEPFASAIESLTRTRQGYTTFDRAHQLEKKGQIAEAITLYHQALLEAPDEPLILVSLGLAYLRAEDSVPARRYLLKALNLQQDYYQSHLGLGFIYLRKEQYTKAQRQLKTGFSLFPTLEGGYLLAEAREKVGDKEGARELYQMIAKADPDSDLGRSAAARLKQMEP